MALAIAGSAAIAFAAAGHSSSMPANYWGAVAIDLVLSLSIARWVCLLRYETLRQHVYRMPHMCVAGAITLLTTSFVAVAFQQMGALPWNFVVAWPALAALLGATNSYVSTRIVKHLAEDGWTVRQVAILGQPDFATEVAALVALKPDVRIVGTYSNGAAMLGWGSEADLIDLVRRYPIDQIIIADRDCSVQRVANNLQKFAQSPVDIALCPGLLDLDALRVSNETTPLLTIFGRPLSGGIRMSKRLADLAVAITMAVALAPLMLAIAVAIKLTSPGPVIFKQRRAGCNETVFWVFKFRSMRSELSSAVGVTQAQRNDPRVTRLGAVLRRYNLDELPQLLNVLRGEMSMVGPRPHALEHNEFYAKLVPLYNARHRVKPGITGWAQVNGFRGGTENIAAMRHRVDHDIFYVANWSMLFDIQILFMTAFRRSARRNAY